MTWSHLRSYVPLILVAMGCILLTTVLMIVLAPSTQPSATAVEIPAGSEFGDGTAARFDGQSAGVTGANEYRGLPGSVWACSFARVLFGVNGYAIAARLGIVDIDVHLGAPAAPATPARSLGPSAFEAVSGACNAEGALVSNASRCATAYNHRRELSRERRALRWEGGVRSARRSMCIFGPCAQMRQT